MVAAGDSKGLGGCSGEPLGRKDSAKDWEANVDEGMTGEAQMTAGDGRELAVWNSWPEIVLWERGKKFNDPARKIGTIGDGCLVPRINEAVNTGAALYLVTEIVHDWPEGVVNIYAQPIGAGVMNRHIIADRGLDEMMVSREGNALEAVGISEPGIESAVDDRDENDDRDETLTAGVETLNCTCGEPHALGTVHRHDGKPCYMVDLEGNSVDVDELLG
jgi:hypothetical protein